MACPQWHCRAWLRAWSSLVLTAGIWAADAWQRLEALPDPRSPQGRIYPLACLIAVAVCAFTAAGTTGSRPSGSGSGGRSRWISGREITLDFPPGAALCAYIDGLVERQDQPIDHGVVQPGATVSTAEPEAHCASVMAAMARYSRHTDDIALLVLRREPEEPDGSGPAPPRQQVTGLRRIEALPGRVGTPKWPVTGNQRPGVSRGTHTRAAKDDRAVSPCRHAVTWQECQT